MVDSSFIDWATNSSILCAGLDVHASNNHTDNTFTSLRACWLVESVVGRLLSREGKV